MMPNKKVCTLIITRGASIALAAALIVTGILGPIVAAVVIAQRLGVH